MTERTDHVTTALNIIDDVDWRDGTAVSQIAEAQVHATLALVEQQRIANIIALSKWQELGGDGAKARISSFNIDGTLRVELAEGLGL